MNAASLALGSLPGSRQPGDVYQPPGDVRENRLRSHPPRAVTKHAAGISPSLGDFWALPNPTFHPPPSGLDCGSTPEFLSFPALKLQTGFLEAQNTGPGPVCPWQVRSPPRNGWPAAGTVACGRVSSPGRARGVRRWAKWVREGAAGRGSLSEQQGQPRLRCFLLLNTGVPGWLSQLSGLTLDFGSDHGLNDS